MPAASGSSGRGRQQRTAEPDGFIGEMALLAGLAVNPVPAEPVGGIDRREHAFQSIWQQGSVRNDKRDIGVADLDLRPHQPLAHGLRRDEESLGDGCGIDGKHGLQHQRRMSGSIQSRMGADEEELQSLIRKYRIVGIHALLRLVEGHHGPLTGGGLDVLVPDPAKQVTLRGNQQPCFGIVGDAAFRPGSQRCRDRVGQGIFRRRHIAEARGEESNQLAVGLTRRLFGSASGL
ncbi:hypothetical protein GFPCMMHI_02621 [Ensifer adhaerens]|nr:hypothetical protein [Ensifer adhaerens]